jgi:hypothetical protein
MSDNVTYTAEDIRRYLEGKMPPAQMHALEKAALSDPFLADALEGMELQSDNDKFNADVHDLHTRLAARVKAKRGALVLMDNLWWKIAAVLIIVATGVAVIIFTGNRNKSDQYEIAKTESKPEDNRKVKKQENIVIPQSADSENVKQAQPANATKKEVATKKSGQKISPAAQEEKPVQFDRAEPKAFAKAEEANVQEDVEALKRPSASSAPSAPAAESVSKESDSMFDEVIVVGYNKGKSDKIRSKTVIAGRSEKRVTPGNGWDEFQRYIEDSTKIITADSVFTGEEHLAFTIGDDGLPESIKILRSVSPSHDKEAIRLLQNGPAWKVTKGRKREIRLKLIF